MGFFDKLKKITSNLFSGFTEADEDFFEELEETLILADLGVDAATGRRWRSCATEVRKEKHLQSRRRPSGRACGRSLMAEMEVGDTALDLSTKPSVVHLHRRQRCGQDHLHRQDRPPA